MNFSTIPDMFLQVCEKFGDSKDSFLIKRDGKYVGTNYNELREQVECFALGLLELGIHEGDRVGIVSDNRLKWVIADMAIVGIGAVDVPVFPTLTAKQEEYIYHDCQATALIVANNFQLGKVLEFKKNIPSLRHIIVMNDKFDTTDVSVKSMDEVIKRGAEIKTPEERRAIFRESVSKIKPDDLLTLIYTSGTTGNPKGVMLTHKNIISNVIAVREVINFDEKDIFLSFLPICHSYERSAGYYSAFAYGCTIAFAEAIETVGANILEVRPTMMTTVPRLLVMIKRRIYNNIAKESPAKQKIFNFAVKTGIDMVRAKMAGKKSLTLAAKYRLADKLVFEKIRTRTGGRLRTFVSGGAALPIDVCEFFLAAGMLIIEGYGLTEASPIISCNRLDDMEPGTVGKPLFNVEVKIAEDGEILARGPNIMQGYWNDPDATHAAIDEEGWLYTGDVGKITARGNIKITDRKKYIFVNTGGKNIAPQPIEDLLCQSLFIEHCVLVGDKRDFITALLTPDFEQLRNLANTFGIKFTNDTELISNEMIIQTIKNDLDKLQKDLAKYERVRKFKLLSQPFTVENGELTPKMSIKRHVVERKYSDLIDQMYGLEE